MVGTALIRPAIVVFIVLMQLLSGCSTSQLHTFQRRADKDDYHWIAQQAITCNQTSTVCGRIHLIKGDACFNIAKAAPSSKPYNACAADELEKGLALIPVWTDYTQHRRVRENLCQSLLNLTTLQSGEPVEQTLARLFKAAKELSVLAPKSVPATYYLACVPLCRARYMLPEINPAKHIIVCNRLKRNLTQVLSMMEAAKEQPPQDWDRFASRVQKLSFDLGIAIQSARCR